MSRYWDSYDTPSYNNANELWWANVQRAIKGKKGQKVLVELRSALQALPKPELIEGALCTFERDEDDAYVVTQKGEGVCAVGAYAWYKKVQSGMDPQAAFESLPTLDDENSEMFETAEYATSLGMTFSLASEIAYRNDETYGTLSPTERYSTFMTWLDKAIIDG